MMAGTTSNLARKFELLQDRAKRRPIREAAMDMPGDAASKKASIGHLKEFYLQRLAKSEPAAAARLGAQLGSAAGGDAVQPQASGQQIARPTFAASGAAKDIEDLEIMCNNCYNLVRSSEASSCTGDPTECPVASKSGGSPGERPAGAIGLLDLKLRKLRAALEVRLQDSSSKVNVMRHLTQLRYHIDTAVKWVPGCPEIGALSDHTVVQVKQLTATSRVLAPAVYIFSKRIENVVVQKERELRRAVVQQAAPAQGGPELHSSLNISRDEQTESVADVNSIVSELDSDTGTQYAETQVTQESTSNDVGNVQDANDYLSLKNEDEQRRWFYSQCLTIKLACPDKNRAKKTLISDLYAKVRAEDVPIEGWVQWIRSRLMPEEEPAEPGQAALHEGARAPAQSTRGSSLEETKPLRTEGRQGSLLPSGSAKEVGGAVGGAGGAPQVPTFRPPGRTSLLQSTYGRRP
mmetsp:Transcript_9211/g.29245  ORF Transcript_9211/g.29245 Transcript_9211/m.29245 type:complete len:463 (-) Transcript_9211:161-1549(-)